MKRIALLMALCLLFALTAACATSETPSPAPADPAAPEEPAAPEPAAPAEGKGVIGVAMPTLDIFFFNYEKDVAVRIAEENGFETKVVVAENDLNRQLSQIEDLINSEVVGIICVPVDTTAIESAIQKSYEAGIPFVTIGRNPSDTTYLTLGVLCDNLTSAAQCAQRIDEVAKEYDMGPVKVIEMIGDLRDQNAVERTEGFKAEAAKLGLEIVAEAPMEWNSELTYSRLNDAIQAVGGDFNAVYIPADPFVPAGLSALEHNGMLHPMGHPEHRIVVGIDGDPNMFRLMREGHVAGTSNTDARLFASVGMEGLLAAIAGNPPAEKLQYAPSIFLTLEVLETPEAQEFWGVVGEKEGHVD